MDPQWFQGGSGSSFLSKCGAGSGSREPYKCGFMEIGILAKICCIFIQKIYFKYRNRSKPGFFQFPCSWIRIQDSQMNADPGGSGSTTLIGVIFFYHFLYETPRYSVAIDFNHRSAQKCYIFKWWTGNYIIKNLRNGDTVCLLLWINLVQRTSFIHFWKRKQYLS